MTEIKNIKERLDKVAYLIDSRLATAVSSVLDDQRYLVAEVERLRGTLVLNNINPETGEKLQ